MQGTILQSDSPERRFPLDLQTFPMFYLISCVIGVLVIIPYTCKGQRYCNTRCLPRDTGKCTWLNQNLYYCACKRGYRLASNRKCEDINECNNASICGTWECVNVGGSYRCKADGCPNGYKPNTSGFCSDINECNFGVCGPSGTCINYWGFYQCRCYSGYRLNSYGRCDDKDECSSNPNICGSSSAGRCVNTPGSYRCICDTGYTLIKNTCTDTNECLTADLCGPLSAGSCANVPGTYSCTCSSAYQLTNGTCTDVDECTKDNSTCNDNADCANFPGGYNCTCATGFSGDGDNCTAVVSSLLPLTDNPGAIVGIVLGVLLGILVITLLLVIIFTRRHRTKRRKEELAFSNRPVAHQPNHVNVRVSDGKSGANESREESAKVNAANGVEDMYTNKLVQEWKKQNPNPANNVPSGDVLGEENHFSVEHMYSNNLVTEKKQHQSKLAENISTNEIEVVYANQVSLKGEVEPYDVFWRGPATTQIGLPEDETYNHLHQRPLAVTPAKSDGEGTDIYNHVYDDGQVPQAGENPLSGHEITGGDDTNEYSLAD